MLRLAIVPICVETQLNCTYAKYALPHFQVFQYSASRSHSYKLLFESAKGFKVMMLNYNTKHESRDVEEGLTL